MRKKTVSEIMLSLLLIGMLMLVYNIQKVRSESKTWTVDDDGPADFHTIQEAVNAANPGDSVYVYNGTYYENVFVAKSVSLIGQNMSNTIIDGSAIGTVIQIMANNVTVCGFTIRNSCNRTVIHTEGSGISIGDSSYCIIKQNNITHNDNGIFGEGGNFNIFTENFIVRNHLRGIDLGWAGFEVVHTEIRGNTIQDNHYYGIDLFLGRNNLISQNNLSKQNCGLRLLGGCRENVIEKNIFSEHSVSIDFEAYGDLETPSNNLIIENKLEVLVVDPAENNVIYHNNFLESNPVAIYRYGINIWDNGYPAGGNYWSDYNGTDLYFGPYQNITGSDGIGDTPYIIDENNQDNYPLMSPWGPVHNTNTKLHYQTIQAAINAPETLDRHTILVDVGTYYEHVRIDKNGLSLIGENRNTTIIDGNGTGSPISIIADSVVVAGFKIRNSRLEYSYSGIRVDDCNHINLTGNTLMNNCDGIFLTYSSNNTISNNIITNNDWNGIHLKYNSNHNVISSNILLNNRNGINTEANSNDNHVLNNYIADSEFDGIDLKGSQNNNIRGNTVTKCFTGIYLGSETDNMNAIYHNYFINNMYQVTCYSTPNMWDDGYPSGGNYWSDYTGVDLFGGPYQNETGSDGIGDTSYEIGTFNQDRYPLMNPYVPLLGDLNGDRTVNIFDVIILANSFGSELGQPRWNPEADLNNDSIINIFDAILIAGHFGEEG